MSSKANKVKCRCCKKGIDKETALNPKPMMYYCSQECYDEVLRKTKPAYKPQPKSPKRYFTDAVQALYVNYYGWDKDHINWAVIHKQSVAIIERTDSNYFEMVNVMVYLQFILGMNLVCKESNYSPLSLIEYYIDEYREFERQQGEIKESALLMTEPIENVYHANNINKRERKELTFE